MDRLARLVVRRPRLTLAAWAVVVAALALIGTGTMDRLGAPQTFASDSPSAAALAAAEKHFGPTTALPTLLRGDPAELDRAGPRLTLALRAADREVLSPWDVGGLGATLRPAPDTALVVVEAPRPAGPRADANNTVVGAFREELDELVPRGIDVQLGGTAAMFDELKRSSKEAIDHGELVAAPILLIVLLLVMRTPVAALLPGLFGGVAVLAGLGILRGPAEATELTVFAASLTTMMGLALGVDYALLVVARYREERRAGRPPKEAAAIAGARAGSTVVLAAVILAVSMGTAVLLSDDGLLTSPAVGVLSATLVAVLGALVALPAMLVVLDRRLERRALPWRRDVAADPDRDSLRHRLTRRPTRALFVALVPLVALAAVATGLDTGPGDVRQIPKGTPAYVANVAMQEAMGPGWGAPFTLVATGDVAAQSAELDHLTRQLAELDGVDTVLGPGERSDDGEAWRLMLIPDSAPNTEATAATHESLSTLAAATSITSGLSVEVGGLAAELADYDSASAEQVPLLIGGLSIVAFLALLVLLRAVVLAALSVVLNLLTVGVAFGAVSLLFQGSDPLLGGSGYVEIVSLVTMATVMFGLSIDYQVFILDRMREALGETGDVREALRLGLDRTAGVVTGAAAIMVGVFLAFSTADVTTLRQFGVGLAIAIAVDATVVRLVLLPAALRLLGRAAWWPTVRFPGADAATAPPPTLPAPGVIT